ncbi:electron transport complex subunit RsxE [Thermospira aquatica]|uniref:Ion-translocating oxidoreductase complex subunit E n=1 Tax=Thermospira aquatica TaxID=2828656 RepID=A0AAX3BF02_9SPIR|nr:electron transport complex subunit E [Thermospira aquatica]URA10791.1 electron transport complex subunit E [Thermospira aquatica]
MNAWKEFTKGIFRENPIFVVVLGLCPTLAVTTQTINGIGMGLAVIFVLTMSNLIISLLRNFIPEIVRIPAYIVIIASFVTIVQMVIKAFAPELDRALGIFIPLIVVNCIILGRAEAFASKNTPLLAVMDGLGMGLGFTLALTLIGFIREILGSGTVTLQLAGIGTVIDFSQWIKYPAVIMILPTGGFIVMGLLLAFLQALKNYQAEKAKAKKT